MNKPKTSLFICLLLFSLLAHSQRNGFVNGNVYDYKKDIFYHTWVTPHGGFKLGLIKVKTR
jgi:hypothetical protein